MKAGQKVEPKTDFTCRDFLRCRAAALFFPDADMGSFIRFGGSVLLVVFLASIVGLLTGISGLSQPSRKQVFSIVGIVLNAIIFFSLALVMIISTLVN